MPRKSPSTSPSTSTAPTPPVTSKPSRKPRTKRVTPLPESTSLPTETASPPAVSQSLPASDTLVSAAKASSRAQNSGLAHGSTTSKTLARVEKQLAEDGIAKRQVDVPPVSLAEASWVSKTRAQQFLRHFFREARFQTVQNPAGSPADAETWQLWCKGDYGAQKAIVEVTAPRVALPLGVLRSALMRVGLDVQVTPVSLRAVPRALPKVKPATERRLEAAQAAGIEAEAAKAIITPPTAPALDSEAAGPENDG